MEDVLHGAQLDPVEEKAGLEAPQLEGEPVARVSDVIVSCYSGRERERVSTRAVNKRCKRFAFLSSHCLTEFS